MILHWPTVAASELTENQNRRFIAHWLAQYPYGGIRGVHNHIEQESIYQNALESSLDIRLLSHPENGQCTIVHGHSGAQFQYYFVAVLLNCIAVAYVFCCCFFYSLHYYFSIISIVLETFRIGNESYSIDASMLRLANNDLPVTARDDQKVGEKSKQSTKRHRAASFYRIIIIIIINYPNFNQYDSVSHCRFGPCENWMIRICLLFNIIIFGILSSHVQCIHIRCSNETITDFHFGQHFYSYMYMWMCSSPLPPFLPWNGFSYSFTSN